MCYKNIINIHHIKFWHKNAYANRGEENTEELFKMQLIYSEKIKLNLLQCK